jgi:enoyl-CoA hydratase
MNAPEQAVKTIDARRHGALGHITLNRPQALHALTLDMCEALTETLVAMENDVHVKAVIIDHASGTRGFCAGGDIRKIAESARVDTQEAENFFAAEYNLCHLIKHYPKPYVAFMDGVTMGGGAGISIHGSHRIATQNTVFAMPETAIGLFCDIGSAWFLPRLSGELGTWLGLTGARLKGSDVVACGLATHVIAAHDLPNVKAELSEMNTSVDAILAAYARSVPTPVYVDQMDVINRCFKGDSLADIFIALNREDSDWSLQTAQHMAKFSPLSLAVTLKHLRQGAKLKTLAEVLIYDFRLARRMIKAPDFQEGVRCALIDNDQRPKWASPIGGTKDADIEALFAPLGADLTFL